MQPMLQRKCSRKRMGNGCRDTAMRQTLSAMNRTRTCVCCCGAVDAVSGRKNVSRLDALVHQADPYRGDHDVPECPYPVVTEPEDRYALGCHPVIPEPVGGKDPTLIGRGGEPAREHLDPPPRDGEPGVDGLNRRAAYQAREVFQAWISVTSSEHSAILGGCLARAASMPGLVSSGWALAKPLRPSFVGLFATAVSLAWHRPCHKHSGCERTERAGQVIAAIYATVGDLNHRCGPAW